jgi:hypothetical protein
MSSFYRNHPALARLLSGVTFAVFLGWFVLPSCHCQWEVLFGGGQQEVGTSELVFNSAGSTLPGQPCHCDDCPGKTFQHSDEAHLRADLQTPFLPGSAILPDHLTAVAAVVLTRGPPPGYSLVHHSEPRTYLRQLSLLI